MGQICPFVPKKTCLPMVDQHDAKFNKTTLKWNLIRRFKKFWAKIAHLRKKNFFKISSTTYGALKYCIASGKFLRADSGMILCNFGQIGQNVQICHKREVNGNFMYATFVSLWCPQHDAKIQKKIKKIRWILKCSFV